MSKSLLLPLSILQVFLRLAYVVNSESQKRIEISKARNDVHNSFKKSDHLEEPD